MSTSQEGMPVFLDRVYQVCHLIPRGSVTTASRFGYTVMADLVADDRPHVILFDSVQAHCRLGWFSKSFEVG